MQSSSQSLLLLLAAVVVCVCAAAGGASAYSQPGPQRLPAKFLGSWTIDHSDNFDEYLEAKGYGWFMRQVVKLASITKIYTDKGNGLYNLKILTTKKNVEWDGWQLGKEFQAEYLDDTQHKVTITYDAGKQEMTEKHVVVGAEEKPADVYLLSINTDGFLEMRMSYNGVETTRYYKANKEQPQ